MVKSESGRNNGSFLMSNIFVTKGRVVHTDERFSFKTKLKVSRKQFIMSVVKVSLSTTVCL